MRPIGSAAALTARAGCGGCAQPGRSAAAGFSLIELMVAISILGILIVLAMPSLSAWVESAKVNSIADFYLDGLRLARNGAQQKSGASRFVLTPNANGQYDWRVDWCFPTSVKTCDNVGTTRWSTATTAASGDINVANPSFSVVRSADSQAPATAVGITLTPGDALSIYFNSHGWVNGNAQPFLRLLQFDANASFNPNPAVPDVRPAAIAINLSGVAERCDPMAAAADSRACPP